MQAALQVRGALSRVAFAVTVLVSLGVLFAPASDVPSAPPGVDKVVHLLLFAALAGTGRWAGFRPGPLALLLGGYAGLSEVLQELAPLDRSGDLVDLLADLAGVGLGLAAWRLAGRRPGRPSS